jgi:hypothetical protein
MSARKHPFSEVLDLPENPSEKAVAAPIAPRFKTEVFQEVAVSA